MKTKTPFEILKPFTASEGLNPILSGVFFSNNLYLATDRHCLGFIGTITEQEQTFRTAARTDDTEQKINELGNNIYKLLRDNKNDAIYEDTILLENLQELSGVAQAMHIHKPKKQLDTVSIESDYITTDDKNKKFYPSFAIPETLKNTSLKAEFIKKACDFFKDTHGHIEISRRYDDTAPEKRSTAPIILSTGDRTLLILPIRKSVQ